MARIRVVCKQPGRPGPSGAYPAINGILADWSDVEITVIHDDGTEEPLRGVTAVRFEAKEGTDLPLLTLSVCDPELEVEADIDLAVLLPERKHPGPYGD